MIIALKNDRLQHGLREASGYCAVAMAFALPLSITLLDVFYLMAVLLALASRPSWNLKANWLKNPVVLFVGLYFLLYVVGLFYSHGSVHEKTKDFTKHYWILGTLLLMPIFAEKKWRTHAMNAFLAAMTITVVLSFLQLGGIVIFHTKNAGSAIFNDYITQSALMCVACIVLLYQFLKAPKKRWYCATICAFMFINIIFFSESRTGYIIFTLLLVYLAYHLFNLKALTLAVASLAVIFAAAYSISPVFKSRINVTVENTISSHYLHYKTSIGRRYAEMQNALILIKDKPIIGYGTGGVKKAFQSLPAENYNRAVVNDQVDLDYFNIALKFGIIGLLVVFGLFLAMWQQARYLGDFEKLLARSTVITFGLGCIANDFMNTTTPGHFLSLLIALSFASLLALRSD